MITAHHLKELRLQKNYTQEHLAFELDISQKTYSNIENGTSKLTLELLQKIAGVYNMSLVNLITKLFESDPEVINHIKIINDKKTDAEIYYGVNHNLPIELIASYKARIDDLNKIIKLKDEQIADLRRQVS